MSSRHLNLDPSSTAPTAAAGLQSHDSAQRAPGLSDPPDMPDDETARRPTVLTAMSSSAVGRSDDEATADSSADGSEAPGTLGSFLWSLLSPSLSDDSAFRHPSRHNDPSAYPPDAPRIPDAEHQPPIHIEVVETKHSLIDLSESRLPPTHDLVSQPSVPPIKIARRPNSSNPTSASASRSSSAPLSAVTLGDAVVESVGGFASSLLGYGKSFFSAALDSHQQHNESHPRHQRYFGGDFDGTAADAALAARNDELNSVLNMGNVTGSITFVKGGKLPEDASVLLTQDIASKLRPSLPPLQREATHWRLIYSLDHHGISLNTMYHKCSSEVSGGNPVLLVIKDSVDCVFGAFASEAFHVQHGYYGNGSSFLWKAVKGTSNRDCDVRVYKASGANDYLILGEAHMIALGGGEGHFGLWVDQDLYNGHSGPCQTFNNEQLSEQSEFTVQGLELWAFDI